MSERLASLFAEFGYGVVFRNVGWVECLLVRGDERWIGRGRDEEEALTDAVHQACPSHLAQTLLTRATASTFNEDASALELARTTEPAVHANDVACEEPPAAARDTVTDLVEPPAVASVPIHQVDKRAAQRAVALEELETMRAKIDADEDELAMCAPQRQRLVLLAWIARARALQREHLGHPDVDEIVTNIARAIGALSKRWWPGSVPALQQAALPGDSARALPDGAEPETWDDVVVFAERALRTLEDSDAARGFDEYGWADARAREPGPRRPSELLATVIADLDQIAEGEAGPRDVERLVLAAQRLRFLRGAVRDVRGWSGAVGRLRSWTASDRFGLADVSRALNPAFAPSTSWATIVKETNTRKPDVDPTVRAREVADALAVVPVANEVDALRVWLLQALPLTDTHHEVIADAVRPHADVIARFGVHDFAGAGRRIHRRLRKLQESLAGVEPTSEPPLSEASLPSLPVVDEDKPEVDVVARTRGRRAVFVTNRNDPELQQRLSDACAFGALDWAESEPRRIDAVADAIASKRYDLVIAATGFLNHTVDEKLSRACRGAGVPYVRANRGRVAACMRALARDL